MAFTVPQQVKHLLETSNHILICFRPDGGGDAVATSCALALFLKSLNKKIDIVSPRFELPRELSFLPLASTIKDSLLEAQKFIISVDMAAHGIAALSYKVADGRLHIFLTPERGHIRKEQLSFTDSRYRYDLIFVVDTPDFISLGEAYTAHTELFYRTPVITIDNDPSNEHFGQINLVELNATSAAEVLYHTLNDIDERAVNQEIATCILTGMIAETRSFKTPQVTPHSLAVAAKLVELGAKREEIVEYLYRTRSLNTLKLWGRALAHLESVPHLGLVWTAVTRDDFLHSDTKEHDLQDIMQELINNTPEAKVSAIFYECPNTPERVCALITSDHPFDAKMLTKPFEPEGTKNQVRLEFKNKSLPEVKELVLGNIKKILGTRSQ